MDEETKTAACTETAVTTNVDSAEPAEPVTVRRTRKAQAARALIQKAKRASRRQLKNRHSDAERSEAEESAVHSQRNAIIGSMRAARRSGT
jgi:hypothetical protein